MKTRTDPRHLQRIQAIQQLFTYSFQKTAAIDHPDVKKIIDILPEIDKHLQTAAPAYPINLIAKIDAAILRFSFYELFYKKDAPPKVILDEAIEVAKEFGGEASASFVNGVLGTLLKVDGETHD